MAKSINSIVVATDTFLGLVSKTNQVISAIGTEVITANSSVNGANTTGNTNLIGIFGANTIAVGTGIRGGTVNAAANLTISSNAVFAGANAAFNSNVSITNSTTSINAVAMYITGPTLSIGSNTTFSGNVTSSGNRLTVASNANFTGVNTILGSTTTDVTSNTFTLTSNTFTLTAANTTIVSNASFSGTLTANGNATFVGDILRGAAGVKGKNVAVANGNIGVTTGSPIVVYSWLMSDYKGGDFTSIVKNVTTVRVSKFLIVTDGTNAYMTEYATLHSPTSANLGVYSVSSNATHAIVRFTQTASSSEVNLNVNLTA
jgi:hypothetical protein